jgi:hypothetical protein
VIVTLVGTQWQQRGTAQVSQRHSKSKTQQCMQEVMNIHLLVALHVNECIQLSHQHVIGITT